MRKFTKVRPETEVEQFNKIPNISTREYKRQANGKGEIISVETDDPVVSAFMISKGFS